MVTSDLLGLPQELRAIVFEFVVVPAVARDGLHEQIKGPKPPERLKQLMQEGLVKRNLMVTLLMLSKQLHCEAIDVFGRGVRLWLQLGRRQIRRR